VASWGAEPKPAWSEIPGEVRSEAEGLLRSRIVRAERVYGGYSPSATFRMRLANGRLAFFKGVYPGANDVMWRALRTERRVYGELAPILGRTAPRCFGSFAVAGWEVLLLEDVGAADVPPWTAERVRRVAEGYARFHRRTLGRRIPRWVPRRLDLRFAGRWRTIAEQGRLAAVSALARARSDEAHEWLEVSLPWLRDSAEDLGRVRGPSALLHLDTRSDNVRVGPSLRIFDWPRLSTGPVEFDVAAFAQSITCEGGPPPEAFAEAYSSALPMRPAALRASIAAVSGYFAAMAPLPPIPGLPRLRSIQRRQLKASLAWAARALDLPEPRWLRAVAD